MDDRFLDEQRRDPRPEFARSLRARLRAAETEEERPAFRLHPALAGGLAVAALAVAFAFPAVRATAQQVLDLFRVREFAVVSVDETNLDRLKEHRFDPEKILGGGAVETLQQPGPPRYFADVAAAERATGFDVQVPAFVAGPLQADSVMVSGEGRVRVTVATAPLREAMDLLGITDLELPAGLDGQVIEARVPAAVVQTFRSSGRRRAALVQAESPEIALPPGTDMKRLGEILLRVMGIRPDEARRLAGVIDWNNTLLVPVLPSATRFQQVSVNGARGVMLQTERTATPDGADRGPGNALLWTRGGRVYALLGNVSEVDMVQMAESVR